MTCIETYSGRGFSFCDPSAQPLDLEEIAHSLAHQCRFTGHPLRFYSVAEHSVHVMRCVRAHTSVPAGPRRRKLLAAALMHDAEETMIGDVSSPLKAIIGGRYRLLGIAISAHVEWTFRLPPMSMASIKHADLACLAAEARQLFVSPRQAWLDSLPEPWSGCEVLGWPPLLAKARFLLEARRLGIEAAASSDFSNQPEESTAR